MQKKRMMLIGLMVFSIGFATMPVQAESLYSRAQYVSLVAAETFWAIGSSTWANFKQKMTYLYAFLTLDTARREFGSIDNDNKQDENIEPSAKPPTYDPVVFAGASAPSVGQPAQTAKECLEYPDVSNWSQHPDAHAPLYPKLNGPQDFEPGGCYDRASAPALACYTPNCPNKEVVQVGELYFCNKCADEALRAQEQHKRA